MEKLKIFSGSSNPEFAKNVASCLNLEVGHILLKRFADDEVQVEIQENVRGEDVFIVQSTCPPTNEHYMELFLIVDALKRASARRITAVTPYYGYSRQDRKVAPRSPISAKLMADLLTASGIHRLLSVDLHAGQIQGFFNVPVDHIFGIPSLARHWRENFGFGEDFVVVSPDAGGVERAHSFAKRIGSQLAIIDKRRAKPNEAKAYNLIGDVRDKTAVIVDDLIDTAGTLTQAVDSLVKNGAKRVFAVATHPVLSGPAIDRIKNSQLERLIVTDSIPLSANAKMCSKIEVVSVAPVVAQAIQRINENKSVSSLFSEGTDIPKE